MLRRILDRHPGSSLGHILFYDSQGFLARVVFATLYRMRSWGVPHVPARGPVLLVANHQSNLDPPALGSCQLFRRHTDFIAKVGLFRSKLLGRYLEALNSVPIRPGEPDTAAIKESLRRLEMGRAVMVFAEGSRTTDGQTQPFKRGIAVLLKRARCPVVPVAIEGSFDAWPRGRALPKLFGQRLYCEFAPAIQAEDLLADGPDAALDRLARQIELMRMRLRQRLRSSTHGRWPRPSLADAPNPAIIPPEQWESMRSEKTPGRPRRMTLAEATILMRETLLHRRTGPPDSGTQPAS